MFLIFALLESFSSTRWAEIILNMFREQIWAGPCSHEKTIVLLTVHPSFYIGLRNKQFNDDLNQLDFYTTNCLITFMKADLFHHIYKIILKKHSEQGIGI